MASEEMKKVRSEITQQSIKDHQLATTGGTGTDQFKCGKCGKRNTTYNQVIILSIFSYFLREENLLFIDWYCLG